MYIYIHACMIKALTGTLIKASLKASLTKYYRWPLQYLAYVIFCVPKSVYKTHERTIRICV